MKTHVVVVIPVHSSAPSQYELIAFKQCFAILHNHPIKVLAPFDLDLSRYQLAVPEINVIRIDPVWQSSVLNYNKLKLSKSFYSLFSDYEYMLTYELDAFVFKDELEMWCNKGYDYIGAPWFEGFDEKTDKIIGVGNSGFSLRKINSIVNGINKVNYRDPSRFNVGKTKFYASTLKYPLALFKNKFYTSENYTIQQAGHLYEDRVICDLMPQKVKNFKIAPIEDALKFSFELRPELLYRYNNNELPMGCHAWLKYNFAFWKPFIESFGYHLS